MAGKDPDDYRPRRAFDASGKTGEDAVKAGSESESGADDAVSGEAWSDPTNPSIVRVPVAIVAMSLVS